MSCVEVNKYTCDRCGRIEFCDTTTLPANWGTASSNVIFSAVKLTFSKHPVPSHTCSDKCREILASFMKKCADAYVRAMFTQQRGILELEEPLTKDKA